MSIIKVLGMGCANCKTTMTLIEQVAAEKGVKVELEKVEDIQVIMGYGVMSTPAVVINETVVHSGGVPSRNEICDWIDGVFSEGAVSTADNSGCCAGNS